MAIIALYLAKPKNHQLSLLLVRGLPVVQKSHHKLYYLMMQLKGYSHKYDCNLIIWTTFVLNNDCVNGGQVNVCSCIIKLTDLFMEFSNYYNQFAVFTP